MALVQERFPYMGNYESPGHMKWEYRLGCAANPNAVAKAKQCLTAMGKKGVLLTHEL